MLSRWERWLGQSWDFRLGQRVVTQRLHSLNSLEDDEDGDENEEYTISESG